MLYPLICVRGLGTQTAALFYRFVVVVVRGLGTQKTYNIIPTTIYAFLPKKHYRKHTEKREMGMWIRSLSGLVRSVGVIKAFRNVDVIGKPLPVCKIKVRHKLGNGKWDEPL